MEFTVEQWNMTKEKWLSIYNTIYDNILCIFYHQNQTVALYFFQCCYRNVTNSQKCTDVLPSHFMYHYQSK